MFPIVILIFGMLLVLFCSSPRFENVSNSIPEYGAIAFGVPAFLSCMGIGILYRKYIGKFVRNPLLFGKLLSLGTKPLTGAIFGLLIAFFIFGLPSPNGSGLGYDIDVSLRAAIFMSIGGLGGLITAFLQTTVKDIGVLKGYKKALIRGTVGDAISIIFFILAYFSIENI